MRALVLVVVAAAATLVHCGSSDTNAPPPYQDPSGGSDPVGIVKSGTAGSGGAATGGAASGGAAGASGASGAAGSGGSTGGAGGANGGASGSAGSGGVVTALPPDDGVTIFNGCQPTDYVSQTGDDDARTIIENSFKYTPKCLVIAAGQTVTWQMDFTMHPLTPGKPGDLVGTVSGAPDSPIVKTSDGTSVSFVFGETGYFPYYCSMHGFDNGGTGAGMVGVIHVQ